MMKLWSLAVAALVVMTVPAIARAQATRIPEPALVPLEVEVTIARYDGTKRISNLPYTLAVNSNGENVRLHMGADVAVPSATFTPLAGNDKQVNPLQSYQYRSVGTTIIASSKAAEDGRFQLSLSIEDSSVFTVPSGAAGATPAFRRFNSSNTLLLRDGQTREYTAATDRVSGEVVKVSVTLRVVK